MSRDLAHIAERMFGVPLLMEQTYAHVVTSVLADRINVAPMVGREVIDSYVRPNRGIVADRQRGITILPVVGGLYHRGGSIDADSGAQSYTNLHNTLTALFNDNVTRGVLLDVDSSGGEAAGIQELSDFIVKASAESGKPVWGVANSVSASAAYWLLAAANKDRLYAAPGSRVGSIGVYVAHTDVSKALEKRGVVTSFIYAGKHKVDGNPFEPLPADVRASIQERVNALYSTFVSHVAERRDLTEEQVRSTEAGVFYPEQAREIGLVNGIAGLGDVLKAMADDLNKPVIGFKQGGDTMTKSALYNEDDLKNARAEGAATAATEHESKQKAAVAEATAKATAAARTEMATAFAALMPESKRVQTFCNAIKKDASIELASEFAGQIEDVKPEAAPKKPEASATEKDAAAILAANAPKVEAEGDKADAKTARLAQLGAAAKSLSKARGYTA